jgi:hypothetical protein
MLIELRKLVVIIESEWKADLPSAPGWLGPEGERVHENSKQLLALVTAGDISSVLDHRSIFDYLGSAWLDCHSKAYKQTEMVSNCLNAELTGNREVREIRDSDGRVFSRSEYLKGKLDGTSRMWSADGTLTLKAHNQNGERPHLPGDLRHLREFESIGGLGSSRIAAVAKSHPGFPAVIQARVIVGVIYGQ